MNDENTFPSAIERTYVIIKPDAWHRNLIGRILAEIEDCSFKIVAMKMFMFTDEQVAAYFGDITSRHFEDTKQYLQSGPSLIVVVESIGAVERMAHLCGDSYGRGGRDLGSLRGRYSPWAICNVIHRPQPSERAQIDQDILRYLDPEDIVECPHLMDIYTRAGRFF